jgi:hypothetical protein
VGSLIMDKFKPGTLHDGICFDHAVPMHGDGEGRIPPRVEEPDMDLEPDAPEVPTVDMSTYFPHWDRLRR